MIFLKLFATQLVILFMERESKAGREKGGDAGKNMDDIELSLIKGNIRTYCGLDDFEKVFEKKKLIGEAIDEFHGKNKATRQNIALMQQRLVQI